MKNIIMKSYVPPHKRHQRKHIPKRDKFSDKWVSDDINKQVNENLKTANFPELSNNKKKQENQPAVNYKTVTDLFKKKRLNREKKKQKLKPGWVVLNKNNKYKKSDEEREQYYQTVILPQQIDNYLKNQNIYYGLQEEITGEDCRYYVSESESDSEISEYESESASDEDNNDDFYDEQDIYLKKYNRN